MYEWFTGDDQEMMCTSGLLERMCTSGLLEMIRRCCTSGLLEMISIISVEIGEFKKKNRFYVEPNHSAFI